MVKCIKNIKWTILMRIIHLMFLYHKNTKWKEVYISPTKEQQVRYKENTHSDDKI